ncbi:ABC transporter substrate-binding protein [Comamonas thiooxydans]|uniref:Bug family tripartite tricarboxylate transporter substrate binding protein n=1 Tax=Comamonas thiooxydans TaxID=363952 RepID=UPI0020CEA348|nr:tripartite tricarboxylate transporter substrate binding protein [Comamonas thiooxydans]BDR09304.1 ABC transporter substrate-binding protein [Comamonas thiooxydans]
MQSKLLHNTRHAAAIVTIFAAGVASAGDKFPSRAIKIVVGSEAGSAPDVLARLVASEMGTTLGQAVIIDNKAGAAGTIGAQAVASAPPDGYTLLMGTVSNIALAPSFYPVRYAPLKSFTPIGMVASVPLVLVVTPSLGATTFAQLQAKVKQSASGEFNFSSPGVGGPQHLAGVLLQKPLGTKLTHVPYKSGGAAMTAVAAGEVQMAFAGIPAATSLAQGNRVTPIMVTSSKRTSTMPEVPSAAEVGLSGFEIDNWHALLAPANLPIPIRTALEAALRKALVMPNIKDQFTRAGAEPATGDSEQLSKTMETETARWEKVVRDNNLKAK